MPHIHLRVPQEDERFLDMATAISGSGPAYVFLTMEAMIDAGGLSSVTKKTTRAFHSNKRALHFVKRALLSKEPC